MVAAPVAVAIAMAAAASTAGVVVSSQQQASAAEYNAKVQEQQAQQQRREALRARGTQEAGYAASGVGLEGSPLAALEQTAVDSELDALSIRYGGAAKARQSLAQAKLDSFQASAARTQGYVEGGAQLLGGLAKAGAQYSDMENKASACAFPSTSAMSKRSRRRRRAPTCPAWASAAG